MFVFKTLKEAISPGISRSVSARESLPVFFVVVQLKSTEVSFDGSLRDY
jgi:hypothetical protein